MSSLTLPAPARWLTCGNWRNTVCPTSRWGATLFRSKARRWWSRRSGGKERRRDDGRQGRAGSAFFAAGRQRKKHRADQKNIAHSAFLPQNRRQNGKKTDSLNRFARLEVEISRTIFLEKRNTLCYDRGMDAGRQSAPGVHAFSIPIFLSFARQVRSP